MAQTTCPYCGVALDRQEDFCPYCGDAFSERRRRKTNPPADRAVREPLSGATQMEKRCPDCLTTVSTGASFCPTCGTALGALEDALPAISPDPIGPNVIEVDTLPAGAWLTLAGGLLMAIGSFLPWMQASVFLATLSRNGMQLGDNMGFSVDGVVTLILGVVTCVIGLSRLLHFSLRRFFYSSSVITGLIAGAITAYNATQLHKFVASIGDESVTASLGYGLWVLLVGCALAIIGGFMVRVAAKLEPGAAVNAATPGERVIVGEPPMSAASSSVADELSKLAGLMERGLLTEDEFAAQKAKLLTE
jgi:uncharacterized Zn finger protein (UPF0148 family)